MPAPLDLIGQRFGRLTVVAKTANSHHQQSRWVCSCECGREVVVLGHLLRSGNTMSCGCSRRLNPYADMMRRVLDEKPAPSTTTVVYKNPSPGVKIGLTVDPAFLEALDRWRESAVGSCTRSEAASRILNSFLAILNGPASGRTRR